LARSRSPTGTLRPCSYTLCERKKRAAEALAYNGLVQSWQEIARLAREGAEPAAEQATLFGDK